jgi:hypothetical protein
MRYAADRKKLGPCLDHGHSPTRDAVAKKARLLRRIIDAIFQSCQRRADRELARFSTMSGRSLTDRLEREMMERKSPSNWSERRAQECHARVTPPRPSPLPPA